VGEAVNEALADTGEDIDNSGELHEVDGQIETLQARILELNKQRTRREIDAERYNTESREVMAKLDTLFIERDAIDAQKSTATLSKAFQAVVAEFLSNAELTAEFDKEIFTRLVDRIIVKNRDNVIFVLKDGTEVKADLSAAE
jgi:superfamily I DNA and RNA helicase